MNVLSAACIAKPLSVTTTILLSLALILLSQLLIPEALASLQGVQPIQWQVVDQGRHSPLFPIHVLSSFINPFDSSDQIRFFFRSSSIPPNSVSFTPEGGMIVVNRANPPPVVGLQIRSETFSPGAYGFIVQTTDEDGNAASALGCLLIRPTNQSCGQATAQQQQQPQPAPSPQQQQQPQPQPQQQQSSSKSPFRALPRSPTTTLLTRAFGGLTGIWQANDGGIYYLRQAGNTLWWNGMSGGNDGRTFDNVFRGTMTAQGGATSISGEWVDVPRGTNAGIGTLSLKVLNPSTLQMVSQTGGFAATTWQKIK